MYIIYIIGKPRPLVVASQTLHGMAYVFFMIVGQIFANTVAPEAVRSSTQALIFAATTGVGLFLGTHAAGIVMDMFSVDGKFQWSKVWLVPCIVMALGMLALVIVFRDPPTEQNAQAPVVAPPAATASQIG